MKLQRCWLRSFTDTPARPNHIVHLCSWGFTHLLPTCNSKQFGYRFAARQVEDIDVIWVEGTEE
ncbi:hypothetical protein D8T31_17880 [Vibrio vulnificus]|nr:hypothetical protein D8T54_22725 [Vibrio vulnificus]RZQ76047.1 hypothetical protein D8T31_17880 [Vibrio vulnificus]